MELSKDFVLVYNQKDAGILGDIGRKENQNNPLQLESKALGGYEQTTSVLRNVVRSKISPAMPKI